MTAARLQRKQKGRVGCFVPNGHAGVFVRFVQCNERRRPHKIRGKMTGLVIMSSLEKNWNTRHRTDSVHNNRTQSFIPERIHKYRILTAKYF